MEDRTVIQLRGSGSVGRGVRLNGVYEIETLLAQGGMGEVYKGFNIQTRDPVAIKMILPELARNPDVFALFRREASTLHNLQHEAIVRYFVFSVDPDLQRAYLAMEFVDGPSLGARLKEGPLPVGDVTILRKRIGEALEAAHSVGVIHRDLSSDNIILPGNDPRRAKIIDFGIARSQRPGEGTLIGGGFAGKYNYVAPEQLGLAGGEVTAQSDIYSFGLVLAEALRGRPIDMGGTQVEVIEKRRSTPDLSDIAPSMRPLLQAMLQPLPANRPRSMAAVAAWSEDAGNGGMRARPLLARRVPEGGLAAGRASGGAGRRLAAGLAALVAVGAIGGALYMFSDRMPWSEQASSQGPGSASPSPDHKPPPLPDLAASAANTAPIHTAVNPPAPPPTGAPVEAPAPPPPTPHVPTADEIIQSSQALAARQPKADQIQTASSAPAPASQPPAPAPAEQTAARPPVPAVVAPAPRPPAPPVAPQASIAMDDGMVGRDYRADLPPFSNADDIKALTLRADPRPPDGLAFADLGSGFSQVSGTPTRAGQYSFDVLARNAAGETARMTVKLSVAPAPLAAPPAPAPLLPTAPTPAPPPAAAPSAAQETPPASPAVAALEPAAKAAAFLRNFDGGSCFFARVLGGAPGSIAIQGIGSDKATFERFYNAFISDIGAEPALTVRLVAAADCPAVELIRADGLDRGDGPKVSLAGYDVGRGKPLSGTIANLAGRRLDLLLVASDGAVHRLDSRPQPGGGGATFSVNIVPDASSIGALQMVLAIAPAKPLHALEDFKTGSAADILPRIRNELSGEPGALDVEFFKMVQ